MNEMDKISKLPDDILLDVLLILDLTHAAQTSVLAKRWRYLWTWRTAFYFHPENTNFKKKLSLLGWPNGRSVYLNWVNQVLDAHRAPCITKFRFYFRHFHQVCNDKILVEKCVRFALSKGVTDLELDLPFTPISSTPISINFPLGFDILKHPPYYNAIVNLKSLRLSNVDITGESLEFILSQSCLLEVLYVRRSRTLHTLNIVSDTLKHLTLITCVWLKELRIDAVNLISFRYDKFSYGDTSHPTTHIVFNRIPKLVDLSLESENCRYPFSVLGQLSCLFNQLTRLSFHPIDATTWNQAVLVNSSDVRLEFDMLFPNAKQLTLTFYGYCRKSVIFVKFFIQACPVLHELKLQIPHGYGLMKIEAKQLQELELENEIIVDMSNDGNPYSQAQEEKVINYVFGRNKTCSNLKALEFIGFEGWDDDVELILDTIADAKCLQTVICDPRRVDEIGTYWKRKIDVARTEEIRRRARKLCKLLSRGVWVGVRDINGLFWVSQN